MPSYNVSSSPANGGNKSPRSPLTKSQEFEESPSQSKLTAKTASDPSMGSPKSKSGSSPGMASPRSKTGRYPLEHQMSTASARRRRFSRRASSAFDFPHLDSVLSAPSMQLDDIDMKEVPWWTSHRLRLAILCFLGFVSLYSQRVNLSIAIVSMVKDQIHNETISIKNQSDVSTYSNTHSNVSVTMSTNVDNTEKCPDIVKGETAGEFLWDKQLVGLILGAFFWGYMMLQVPGGRLSERFGAKKVIAITMFPVAILNILTPVVARLNPYLFLVLRVFIGVGEGAMYPAAQALWSRWAPPNERSRLIGFSYAGGQFGNAIIFPIGGYLCAYGFDGGWPSVFYLIGGLGFVWCVAWCLLAHDSPDECPGISDIEKKYIHFSLGDRTSKKKQDIPWKKILTSRAVWAIIIAHMCGNYGAYMLLTKIPAYMKEVLKFDIKSNGLFSMLPYLAFWFFITFSGTIADLLMSRDLLSVAKTRKIMSAIGTVGPAAFLVGTGFMDCTQQTEAVVMLTCAVGLCGFHFSGYFINHGDIAPQFAGTLFGISNMMATIPGIFSPYVVASMTPNGTREEWLATFYVAAAIYVGGALWYCIMGQGEIQEWAKTEEDDDDEEDEPVFEGEDGVGFGLHEIHETVEENDDENNDDDEDDTGKILLPNVKPDATDNKI